jgi:hypothetical protein
LVGFDSVCQGRALLLILFIGYQRRFHVLECGQHSLFIRQ